MAIIDRIKYDGNSNGGQWLIYKYPSEQFVLGSQLIVNQGQEALFFKGGEALDLFGAGTHTLSSGNLPILNKLVNYPFGGKTPFSAEIYYINKTVNLDMKWGTSTPIPFEDPRYSLILDIGARGQYGITITDSRLFVSKIIGAVSNGTTTNPLIIQRYFNGLINSKIKSITATYMIQRQISFLEISQFLPELSAAFQKTLNEEFERFGIELVNFYCESIAPKAEEYEKFRCYKEELALGQGFYQQRRTFDILEKLADAPSAGGIANIGMGLSASGQFGNVFSGIGQNMNAIQTDAQVICPKCGTQNSLTMKFCGECGESLSADKCPFCGFENKHKMKFCGNCGEKL